MVKKLKEGSEGAIVPKSKKGSTKFVRVPGLEQDHWLIPIVGTTPLVMGRLCNAAAAPILKSLFSEKFKKGLKKLPPATPLDVFAGAIHQVNNCQTPRTTELEFPFVWYWDFHKARMRFSVTCTPGFPTIAVKKGLCYAAELLDKSPDLINKTVMVQGDMISIEYDELIMQRLDSRSDNGVPIQSYLPAFCGWKSEIVLSVIRGRLDWEAIAELVSTALARSGLGKQRPEKSGQFGVSMIDSSRQMRQITDDEVLEWYYSHTKLDEEATTVVLNEKEIITREKTKKEEPAEEPMEKVNLVGVDTGA